MDYIKYMRKLIGKKPLLICGAGVIVLDDKNRVLMQLRVDNNSWGFPGGILELGEKVEDAAARELKFLDKTFYEITSFFTLMYIKRHHHKEAFLELYRV